MSLRFVYTTNVSRPTTPGQPQTLELDVLLFPGDASEDALAMEYVIDQQDRLVDMGYRLGQYLEEHGDHAFLQGLRDAIGFVGGEVLEADGISRQEILEIIENDPDLHGKLTKTSMAALEDWAAEEEE